MLSDEVCSVTGVIFQSWVSWIKSMGTSYCCTWLCALQLHAAQQGGAIFWDSRCSFFHRLLISWFILLWREALAARAKHGGRLRWCVEAGWAILQEFKILIIRERVIQLCRIKVQTHGSWSAIGPEFLPSSPPQIGGMSWWALPVASNNTIHWILGEQWAVLEVVAIARWVLRVVPEIVIRVVEVGGGWGAGPWSTSISDSR